MTFSVFTVTISGAYHVPSVLLQVSLDPAPSCCKLCISTLILQVGNLHSERADGWPKVTQQGMGEAGVRPGSSPFLEKGLGEPAVELVDGKGISGISLEKECPLFGYWEQAKEMPAVSSPIAMLLCEHHVSAHCTPGSAMNT